MRAIRLTRSNWLNDQVGGDQNAIRFVEDNMAYEAVAVWEIAVYAPEHDPATTFVGTEAAAARTEELVQHFAGTAEDTVDGTENDEPPPDTIREVLAREADEAEAVRDSESAPLEQPFANANKATWIEWAAHGDHGQPPITEEDAAKLAKTQLMHRYGGRL